MKHLPVCLLVQILAELRANVQYGRSRWPAIGKQKKRMNTIIIKKFISLSGKHKQINRECLEANRYGCVFTLQRWELFASLFLFAVAKVMLSIERDLETLQWKGLEL